MAPIILLLLFFLVFQPVASLRDCPTCVQITESKDFHDVGWRKTRSLPVMCPSNTIMIDHECHEKSDSFYIRREDPIFIGGRNETDDFQLGIKCVVKPKHAGKSVKLTSTVVCRPVDEEETLMLRSRQLEGVIRYSVDRRSLTCPPDEVVTQSYCYFSNTDDFNTFTLNHEFEDMFVSNLTRRMPVKFTCAIVATGYSVDTVFTNLITCAKVKDLPTALASSTSVYKQQATSIHVFNPTDKLKIRCKDLDQRIIAYYLDIIGDRPFINYIRFFGDRNGIEMEYASHAPKVKSTLLLAYGTVFCIDKESDYHFGKLG